MLFHRVNLVSCIKIYIIFLLLMPCGSFSQGISNLWLSGYSSGFSGFGGSNVNFINQFADTNYVYREMNFLDCNANISDSLGNLLFYTNGIYIANANNDTMVNGSGLSPSVYTTQHLNVGLRVKQGNLILPMPGSSNMYYLFHETLLRYPNIGDYRVSELYYSTIDMSLDSGRGAVTQKNVVLISDTLTIGSITACKHANGRDWWLVFHRAEGRRYYEYLFTPAGLQGPFVQDIGYSILPRDWSWQSCFSPDGNKYANVFTKDTTDIMDFDRCTGLFSNCISIYLKDSANARGIAFSSNSKFMYVSSSLYVYQYSINSNPIDSGKVVLGKFDYFAEPTPPLYTAFYLAQLANDGKIYINSGNSTRWFNVINQPNNSGLSCDFLQHSLMLPTFNSFSIPNFPNYFLGKENGSVCDSLPSVINQINSPLQRKKLIISPLRLVSDSRGEAVLPINDEYNESTTFSYFLEKTSQALKKEIIVDSNEKH